MDFNQLTFDGRQFRNVSFKAFDKWLYHLWTMDQKFGTTNNLRSVADVGPTLYKFYTKVCVCWEQSLHSRSTGTYWLEFTKIPTLFEYAATMESPFYLKKNFYKLQEIQNM